MKQSTLGKKLLAMPAQVLLPSSICMCKEDQCRALLRRLLQAPEPEVLRESLLQALHRSVYCLLLAHVVVV